LQWFGLELIDFAAFYFAFLYSNLADSYIYTFLSLAAAIYFIQKKNKKPQGYCKHLLYYLGLYRPDRYPAFSKQEFLE
jgi:hypothetical protein